MPSPTAAAAPQKPIATPGPPIAAPPQTPSAVSASAGAAPQPPPPPSPPRGPYRRPWATLLRRVFAVDVLPCDRCGGKRRLVALIEHDTAIQKILTHLGLPTGKGDRKSPV